MRLKKIKDVFLCSLHGKELEIVNDKIITSCCNETLLLDNNNILIFDENLSSYSEVKVRNNQAKGYLTHDKFPTQISRMQKWMDSIPKYLLTGATLDLGCGPGPTTNMLLEIGAKNILSTDFSINSLKINKNICQQHSEKPIYVLQDLRDMKLNKNSISVLVMADFLQHIIDEKERNNFLNNVFESLIPNGCFFLSFFNINIKNYLKNDIDGSFSNGNIKYERLNYKKVIYSLPNNIVIDRIIPMNISRHAVLDRLLCSLPFSSLFSRMVVLQGRKLSNDN